MSGETNFKSKDFAIRAQKKILGQLSSRKTAKVFVNEGLSNLLDSLFQLIKIQTGDKKIAEKFVKNIIKLSIKIGILVQNDQFSKEELQSANKFTEKFRTIAMTITSFIEVDYSYDRPFLFKSIDQCEKMIVELVKPHLTEKSVNRILSVTSRLRDSELLDAAFHRGTPHYEIMQKIVIEINNAIERGDF